MPLPSWGAVCWAGEWACGWLLSSLIHASTYSRLRAWEAVWSEAMQMHIPTTAQDGSDGLPRSKAAVRKSSQLPEQEPQVLSNPVHQLWASWASLLNTNEAAWGWGWGEQPMQGGYGMWDAPCCPELGQPTGTRLGKSSLILTPKLQAG